jgi:methionyl aminopeptidase
MPKVRRDEGLAMVEQGRSCPRGPQTSRRQHVTRSFLPWRRMIEIKSPGELEGTRAAGAVVADAPSKVTGGGRTRGEHGRAGQARRAGYPRRRRRPVQGLPRVPGQHLRSVKRQIVHGIPSKPQVLANGHLISVDCGAILDNWQSDSAVTPSWTALRTFDQAPSDATGASMEAAPKAAVGVGRPTDISHAIEASATPLRARKTAHTASSASTAATAVDSCMYMDSFLPNYGKPGKAPRPKVGMAIAIESMQTLGTEETDRPGRQLDGRHRQRVDSGPLRRAVAITEDGPRILLLPAGFLGTRRI